MSAPLKMCLGCAGLAGVSGAGYLGWRSLPTKESLKSKYQLAVKGFFDDTTTINKKLEALKEESSQPKHPDLQIAKQKKKDKKADEAKSAFEKGCKSIHEESIDSLYFDDFKNYCSFNNGDKIETGKGLVDKDTDFDSSWDGFKQKGEGDLQEGFQDIHKTKGQNVDATWKGKMLTECKRLSTEIFKGEIPNFKEFCTKTAGG
ncbi:hypothetical protein HF1_04750 [Mycoplasma haemofelis str. Langford 1]|uniref:Uncharacterized protein n=1 Tax=Mycoplasma haemofelis (strain Langford 1) TaxID=941640 RepID=E8ZH62_MYCHL|nr:hypothetical protein [Mycoplasma haemofelis]CBY92483.1 hypothetical protein HF1_04750 [Mycoplasma haemofelis str. Langford 1]